MGAQRASGVSAKAVFRCDQAALPDVILSRRLGDVIGTVRFMEPGLSAPQLRDRVSGKTGQGLPPRDDIGFLPLLAVTLGLKTAGQ